MPLYIRRARIAMEWMSKQLRVYCSQVLMTVLVYRKHPVSSPRPRNKIVRSGIGSRQILENLIQAFVHLWKQNL